ncbi:MAG: GTP cyclohydrolase I [Myxococcales bacterium]|nr:GTP cyclohydrolase I [Myxococcales bacterium]
MKTAADAISAFLAAVPGPIGDAEEARTPERVAAFWTENLLAGYAVDPKQVLAERIVDRGGAVVTLTHVPFHAVCPHHLIPFFGVVHLAYEPDGHIVGLGALEQLVFALSRRRVLQEALCAELVDALITHLGARGAACAIEAQHLCLILRGREPRGARVATRLARGSLRDRTDILPPMTA